ncbi:MAG TPA: cysteine desulfurase family protein [Methylomirabilota bacterium]|nr:cysteine desulfurase family protein [Methylomirabilota bacterium]
MRRVFLDHQSTTPLLPEVLEAMRPFLTDCFAIPASLHQEGLQARDALQQAREQVAALIHAESPETILFTSNGTEAVNLAIKGAAWAGRKRGRHIVTTAIEHPAVLNSIEFLESQGFTATRVPVDDRGFVDPDRIRRALTDETLLICVHLANHDLGTIQPAAEIGRIAADRSVPLFVDAVAAGGWLPIHVEALGAGLLALSPHRFHGPKGAGVLYRNRRARLTPLIHGGDQEEGRRAGTENVPAIVGTGVAAEIAARELDHRRAHVSALQRRLLDGLRHRVDHLHLNGPDPGDQRLGTLLNVSVEFVEGEGVLLMADLRGIALASGTSCISRSLKVSPVLAAIGLPPGLAQGSVLLSPGRDTTEEDVDYAVETLGGIVEKLRAMSPLWDEFQRGNLQALTPARAAR